MVKRNKIISVFIFVLLIAMLMPTYTFAAKLNKKKLTLAVGKTYTLRLSNGSRAKWKSSNKKVASVSQNGVVKGKKAGSTVITAKVGKKKYKCKVKVKLFKVKALSIAPKTITLRKNNTYNLKISYAPNTATPPSCTWKSNNTRVAVVSKNGTVRVVSAGTATITATDKYSKKKATCTVYGTSSSNSDEIMSAADDSDVKVTKITISGPTTVEAGNRITLTTAITPSNATDKTVTWTSSNTGVASINSQGVVTGVSPGSAIIVAKANDGSGVTAGAVIAVTEKTTPTPVTPTYTYSLSVGTIPKKVAVNESVTVTCTISSNDSNAKLKASTNSGSCLLVGVSGRTVVLTGKIQTRAVPVVITYGDKSYSFTIDVYDKESKEYIEEQWRKKMISQMGLTSMPPLQRFTTITQHIAMNYPYRYTPEGKTFTFSNDLVNRYPNDYILGGDCVTSATEIYEYALLMGYNDNTVQAHHPYSGTNHTQTKILINNQWIAFDAGYSDTWTQESGRSWSVHNLSTGEMFGYIPNNAKGDYCVVAEGSTKYYDHLVYPNW